MATARSDINELILGIEHCAFAVRTTVVTISCELRRWDSRVDDLALLHLLKDSRVCCNERQNRCKELESVLHCRLSCCRSVLRRRRHNAGLDDRLYITRHDDFPSRFGTVLVLATVVFRIPVGVLLFGLCRSVIYSVDATVYLCAGAHEQD